MVGSRTNEIAFPMKGRTKDGPGIERFLLRYEICSMRRRKRMKHIRYGINWLKEKEDNNRGAFMFGFLIRRVKGLLNLKTKQNKCCVVVICNARIE